MSSIFGEHTHKTKLGKFFHTLVHILLYLWQLPQNLAGLMYKVILRGEKRILKQRSTAFFVAPTMNGGVSLGNYIFLSEKSGLREPVYDHEFGHCIQSRILGPIYLPIVGLCSGIHCLTYSGKGSYYDYWTERWANKLGGIEGYAGEYHYHKPGVIYTTAKALNDFYKEHFK